ncbi:MAG: hypothetical protein PHC28_11105 [Flavobacterium sp.]|uniref:hypothetical protein n=1 Tax=Flavobacterium sp. TaxID=239 RepID=UPI00261C9663|nr:hypothetical protein [Flavobacterium sp.]MDD5151003.1 hypothetical protein [Flavobacterium sp.]
MGYLPILINQKTSLKKEYINGDCLASEFDNMFYNTSKIHVIYTGIIPFYKNFDSLEHARIVSDHIPIWFKFSLN